MVRNMTKKLSDLDKVKRFFKKHKMPFEESSNMFVEQPKNEGERVKITYLPYLYVNFNKRGKVIKPF